jgi:hypothetical protein
MDISSKVSYRIVNSIVCLLVFSVPAGALAMILILFFVPKNFPYQGQPAYENRRLSAVLTKTQFKSVDFIGAGLLLTATLFLVCDNISSNCWYCLDSILLMGEMGYSFLQDH